MTTAIIKDRAILPLVIDLPGLDPAGYIAYYRENNADLAAELQKYGAIKFTGVEIGSTAVFQQIVDSISSKFLAYIDGNSPRTRLSGNVYTSTEYDRSQKITMHNELSYSAKWPNKLFFTCLQPATTGGETLLADSRQILQRMSKTIVDRIADGVIYIRNLHGGVGVGPSWQDTFETTDRRQMEEYCKAYSIDYEWKEEDAIRLKQLGPGIIRHRVTGEMVWFNQTDQFHPYQLGEEMNESLRAIYDSPEDFPTYVTFRDGTRISDDMIREILGTIEGLTLAPSWEKNELLIVDNELVSHGRNPYTGERRVLVSMSE